MRAFKTPTLEMAILSVATRMRRAIGLEATPRAPQVDDLHLVLPDLRTVDPGFLPELRDGRLALLEGAIAIGTQGVFDTTAPTDAQRRDLYAFGWLRHLGGARTVEAGDHARRLLLAWSRSIARRGLLANEPAVASRRLLSMLAHIDTALAGASAADFDRIADMVAGEAKLLGDAAKRMPMALPRLTALIALTAYAVCRGAKQAERTAVERRLASELDRQILPDGGHLSRNPAAVLELALDLLPLHRAYVAADLPRPPAMAAALTRLGSMLMLLSHVDRQLGRFNGMGHTALTELSMVLKTLPARPAEVGTHHAADSGYVRVVNGETLLLVDAGPGAETLAGETPFAGALSFELSSGRAPIVVNIGSEHTALGTPRIEVRATASHSALVLGGISSAPPTGARGGSTSVALVADAGDAAPLTVRAEQSGYRQRFGYLHQRTLALLRDGWLLEGVDRLEPVLDEVGVVAFDIRFHLHPTVHVAADPAQAKLRLTLADGSRWIMTVQGATALIEPSSFAAGPSGPKASLQIVLAGQANGATEVTWKFERMSPAAVS